MAARITRRKFLAASAASTLPAPMFARDPKPGSKLNIAVIGINDRGAANVDGVKDENIVALCDVDEEWSGKQRESFPKAAFFTDYRKMFDAMASKIDAVVVATPDHSHSLPSCIAMNLGKHVYCEKPMAETVNEVRTMREFAMKKKLVTQMGTQIHAGENYRRVVEVVRSGALGEIHRVWVWNSSRPVGGKRVSRKPSAKFDLDLWMGPTTGEFFEAVMNKSGWNFAWPHFHWRWWWEWGGGTLADLGCHYIDLPYWALGLTSPTKVSSTGKVTYSGDNTTPDIQTAEFTFPTKSGGELILTWEHGVGGPNGGKDMYKGYGAGIRFDGTKGQLVADYGKFMILPEEFARGFRPPQKSIPPSIGHHREWCEAIKNGGPTTCNFEYAGRLAECVLLGNVAYRARKAIQWDHAKGTTGDTAADAFLARAFRRGWELPKV